MFLLDSNILLEFFYKRRWGRFCEVLLSSLNVERMGWVTAFTVHGICAMVGKKGRANDAIEFIEYFLDHPGLRICHTSMEDELSAAKTMEQTGLDFDDALQYTVAKNHGLTLVTLDQDFKKIQDIPVRSPVDLVN